MMRAHVMRAHHATLVLLALWGAPACRFGRSILSCCWPPPPIRFAAEPLGFKGSVGSQNLTAAVYSAVIGRTPETLKIYKVGLASGAGASQPGLSPGCCFGRVCCGRG